MQRFFSIFSTRASCHFDFRLDTNIASYGSQSERAIDLVNTKYNYTIIRSLKGNEKYFELAVSSINTPVSLLLFTILMNNLLSLIVFNTFFRFSSTIETVFQKFLWLQISF